jgi:serine/threonine-protein kinase RsbW
MGTETRTFVANLDSLDPIREFIAEKAKATGMDKKRCYSLCLAADELSANIINYGYPLSNTPDADKKITVVVNINEHRIEVVLEDRAVQFDPFGHADPTDEDLKKPLEERSIGGLGIMLAKSNVDSFKYEYINNVNRNILIMNLPLD